MPTMQDLVEIVEEYLRAQRNFEIYKQAPLKKRLEEVCHQWRKTQAAPTGHTNSQETRQ